MPKSRPRPTGPAAGDAALAPRVDTGLSHPAKATSLSDDRSTPLEADWIAAARAMLIEKGIAAVQINALANRLGVTRGGFYWRFRDRRDLLKRLLDDWRARNVLNFLQTIGRKGAPVERYRRLIRLWIDEVGFDPVLDAAVRQWGRVEAEVGAQVLAADEDCIAAIADIFLAADQAEDEAFVRARIVYFHQIGYWALGLSESSERRRELMPIYTRLLTGFEP